MSLAPLRSIDSSSNDWLCFSSACDLSSSEKSGAGSFPECNMQVGLFNSFPSIINSCNDQAILGISGLSEENNSIRYPATSSSLDIESGDGLAIETYSTNYLSDKGFLNSGDTNIPADEVPIFNFTAGEGDNSHATANGFCWDLIPLNLSVDHSAFWDWEARRLNMAVLETEKPDAVSSGSKLCIGSSEIVPSHWITPAARNAKRRKPLSPRNNNENIHNQFTPLPQPPHIANFGKVDEGEATLKNGFYLDEYASVNIPQLIEVPTEPSYFDSCLYLSSEIPITSGHPQKAHLWASHERRSNVDSSLPAKQGRGADSVENSIIQTDRNESAEQNSPSFCRSPSDHNLVGFEDCFWCKDRQYSFTQQLTENSGCGAGSHNSHVNGNSKPCTCKLLDTLNHNGIIDQGGCRTKRKAGSSEGETGNAICINHGIPGVYFDRRKKGFRVRFQNVYVGWVSLSRYSSYDEAYIIARKIWDDAVREATTYQNKQAAVNAGIPLQIQSRLEAKNPGGRPRTISRLSPDIDAKISAVVANARLDRSPHLMSLH